MKRLNFLFIAATFVACVMSSCVKEGFSERVLQNADGTCSVKLAVDMAAPVGDEASVKSAMLPEGESLRKVTNLNYYVFDSAGNFISQTFYDGDLRNFHVELPDYDGTYKVFFFANVGEFQIPENTKAEDMATACHYDYSTYSNYVSKIKSLGFPAALAVLEFNAKTAASISIIPLVYTLKVKINKDALSDFNNLTIKQIRVRQAARDIFPFSPASKLTQKFDERPDYEASDGCDYLSVSDISKLTSKDNSVNLYMLENMRGELLSGNESWKNKIPANITSSNPGKNEDKNSTYIEISAEASTPTAEYDNVIYRAYLGKSASNFDVQRNTVFTLTNNFTDDMVTAEDWRIEPGTPTVTGSLEFVLPKNDPNSLLAKVINNDFINDPTALQTYVNTPSCMIPDDSKKAPSNFYLTDDFAQVFFIYRSNKDITYDINVSQPKTVRPYLDYTIERYNDNYDKITICSSKKETYLASVDDLGFNYLSNGDITGVMCNGSKPRKEYPVTITVTSSDGLISSAVTCKYFYGKQGIKFAKASTGYDEVTRMYSANLLKLNFSVDTFGRLGCFFNGYNGFCQLKRNADTEFLEYIGSPTRTDKYGSGNQEASTLRWTECVPVSNPGHANDLVSAWFPLGIGVIKVYVSGQTGTSNKFPASILYIPYRTKHKLAIPTLSGVDYYDRGMPSTSNYWGDYDAAVRYWSQTKSFQDAFKVAIEKTRLKVYDEDTRKTYTRYPCPFALEEHVDMFLGSYRLYSAGVHPAVKLSSTPGLYWTQWSGDLTSPSSTEMYAYKGIVGDYICDQTTDSASSLVYW